jgi:hypothetical protein
MRRADKWLRSRAYANAIEGWQWPFYEFDKKRGHILNRNSIFQTYVAQECEDIDDAPEAGIDLYLDLDEAIARYPTQKDAILADSIVTSGNLTPPQSAGQVPTQYTGEFRRPMVRKVVWWIRNQPVGVAMALERGLVIQQQQSEIPNEQTDQANVDIVSPDRGTGTAANKQGNASGGGLENSGPAASASNDPVGQQGVGTDAALNENDLLSSEPGIVSGGDQVAGYYLPDGTPVTPDSPDWPLAIRQISIINNAVVEDVVCPWPDIPILHMRNTLIVGKPWGVGEPFYSKNLQDAYSTITDSAIRHTQYNANAAMEMHQGLMVAMQKEYGEAFVNPGKIIGIPANLWQDGKPLIRPDSPAAIPAEQLGDQGGIEPGF